ncbi:MAG: hypothetical protein ACREBU_22715, partial [Nitrososphaera sp.]
VICVHRNAMKELRFPNYSSEETELNTHEPQLPQEAPATKKNTAKSLPGSQAHGSSTIDARELSVHHLSNEQRMKLWTDFPNRTIPEIIASYGFLPELVYYEYQWYEKLKGMNMHDVQREVVAKVGESMDVLARWSLHEQIKEYHRLLELYNRDRFLPGQQFKRLLEIYEKIAYCRGKDFVNDVSEAPPPGWRRPTFGNCEHPIPGVVVDPSGYGGDAFLACGKVVHLVCPH